MSISVSVDHLQAAASSFMEALRVQLDRIPPSLHVPLLYLVPVLVAVLVYPIVARYVVRKLDAALRRINSIGASILRHKEKEDHHGILLPNQAVNISKIGLDIGGSLAKLVYFEPNNQNRFDGDPHEDSTNAVTAPEEYEESVAGGTLRFVKFEVRKLHELLDFMKANNLHVRQSVHVSGGGAHKYATLFEEKLGIKFEKEDEMLSLIDGLNFLLLNIPDESFTYSPEVGDPNPKSFVPHTSNPFPYLLVNIGSGVSVIRVDSEDSYERVDGTSLGGGTFWGLCHLLTGVSDFDQMLELCQKGKSEGVDLLVGDIYGSDYSKIGLSSTVIASSFGKVIYKSQILDKSDIKPEDMANSLLRMVSNNIGQIAYLNAMRFGLKRIYFGGFFIRNNPLTMAKISFAINFWSKGHMKAHFLTHEGYLGAVGALIAENKSVLERSKEWLRTKQRELGKMFNLTGGRPTTPGSPKVGSASAAATTDPTKGPKSK